MSYKDLKFKNFMYFLIKICIFSYSVYCPQTGIPLIFYGPGVAGALLQTRLWLRTKSVILFLKYIWFGAKPYRLKQGWNQNGDETKKNKSLLNPKMFKTFTTG